MEFGIGDILQILGALAFFIYGMKMMSDGIQRAAGSQLRNILRTMTKNRFLGVFTGFLTTALVQSSSATTVMTVSFVNAGLLTLLESAGVLMGANIGTTITGWIVSILGFKIKLSTYSIPLFAIGVPLIFSGKNKLKHWGDFIIGFAILFLGLSYLKDAVPDLKGSPEALAFLKSFTEWGLLSRLFFVLIGTIVTVIVQSSSAAMAITLTMCANGWLPFDVAAAMILGENIGTTITAQIASLVGNINAKRAAAIHTIFNVFGVIWMVLLMPICLMLLSTFLINYAGLKDPFTNPEDMPIALSAFHTFFNITNVILLIAFVPFLVKAATWVVKSSGEEDEEKHIKFINTTLKTPELAIDELKKETAHFGEVTKRMAGFTRTLINTTDAKVRAEMHKKIEKYEDITDKIEIDITEYITQLLNEEVTKQTSIRLRSILNITNDLERIGDIFYQVSKTLEKKNEDKVYFLPEQRKSINDMLDLVDAAFDTMTENLNNNKYSSVSINKANDRETAINQFRDELKQQNLDILGKKGNKVKSVMVSNNLVASFEKVGDHIINVSESVVGEI